MDFIENLKQRASKSKKRIVLPEGNEERNLRAADQILAEGFADIILLTSEEELKANVAKFGLKNIDKAIVIDPMKHAKKQAYIELLVKLREKKGMTVEKATVLVQDPLYLGALMIKAGDADGEVSGAIHATGDVLRPALQLIKTKPGISTVSGAFLMFNEKKEYGENGVMVFADCAVTPEPTAQQLAEIAVATGETARILGGFEPKIAMLSFSTKGSASHDVVDKVIEATKLAKELAPELQIDGELQADAAIVPTVGALKAPGSEIAGKANVLVFPNLEVGNIAYKLVQRLAGSEALGPILQGIACPVNDLSRGCSVSDIVKMVAITANQAIG
ncbi:MAG: phosphate acetyltransferase [Marinilabiliaceae bacterium]|nr:phosphate acetyltransferase [Marinilabiliaceae bacterium]